MQYLSYTDIKVSVYRLYPIPNAAIKVLQKVEILKW